MSFVRDRAGSAVDLSVGLHVVASVVASEVDVVDSLVK
jgi:hypothetical protein